MAITYAQVGDNGLNAQEILQHATLIESFTYDLKEAPEIHDMVAAFRDPMIIQFMIDASVATNGSFSSDQLRWFEKGRIQNAYKDDVDGTAWSSGVRTLDFSGSATDNFDIRKGETLWLGDNANNKLEEVFVVSVDTAAQTAVVRSKLATPVVTGTTGLTVTHASSDYNQGSTIDIDTITYGGVFRSNNPIILRDMLKYDRSKIGQMVQFTDDLKSYAIDRKDMDKRFDVAYLNAAIFGSASEAASAAKVSGVNGAESVMSAIEDRGNTATGSFASIADIS